MGRGREEKPCGRREGSFLGGREREASWVEEEREIHVVGERKASWEEERGKYLERRKRGKAMW